jgi:hypothetical protein
LYADKIIIKKDKGKRVPVVIPVCRWGWIHIGDPEKFMPVG